MSPVFNENDSPLKKTVMIMFWIVCGAVALKIVQIVLSSLGGLIAAAVWIGPAIWVYWHAQSHDVPRPFLWGLLALFTSVVGLVVYLIVHSDDCSLALCPTCGSRVRRDYQKCPHCGTALTVAPGKCASCGRRMEPSWDFCARCGAPVPKPPSPIIT